jgi:hypothetical protein
MLLDFALFVHFAKPGHNLALLTGSPWLSFDVANPSNENLVFTSLKTEVLEIKPFNEFIIDVPEIDGATLKLTRLHLANEGWGRSRNPTLELRFARPAGKIDTRYWAPKRSQLLKLGFHLSETTVSGPQDVDRGGVKPGLFFFASCCATREMIAMQNCSKSGETICGNPEPSPARHKPGRCRD